MKGVQVRPKLEYNSCAAGVYIGLLSAQRPCDE